MTVSNISNNGASIVSLTGYGEGASGSTNTNSVAQLLQDISNLLQNSSGVSPQASTGTPATGTPSTGAPATGTGTGAPTMNAQTASGSLAGYMGTNGNQSLDMNDLYQLSQGQPAGGKGQAPSPQVQQAAQYMMANPGTYNQIETNDVAGADGKSGATNFENAAQGLVPGIGQNASQTGSTPAMPQSGSSSTMPTTTASTTTPATTGTTTPATASTTTPATGTGTGSATMNPQSASGSLAGYMGTNGNQSLDMNDLYQLSQGKAAGGNGQAPSPQVQQAAQYMMANPGVYNKIETNDVAGADGKSGATNFQNAAQGLVPGLTSSTPQTASTQTTPLASTGTPTPTTATPTTTAPATGTGSTAVNEQSAAGSLAGYMGTNGNQSLDMNALYQLSQGKAAGGNGQVPSPDVQQAAQYMMANPGVFNKIETNDVAGADGKSGVTNFQNAAQGTV
jgi:hypothetical protein